MNTTIDTVGFVTLFSPYLQAIAALAIPIFVTIFGAYLKAKYNIEWDAENRDAFQTSALNAAGRLIQKVGSTAAMKIDVGNPALAEFINDVQKGAPAAVAGWGLTPDAIAKKIVSKIPQVLNTTEKPRV